jgi:osmoprotectant transport system permease protein
VDSIWREQLSLLPEYLSRHLLLSVTALAIGIAVSVPLAYAAIRHRWLQGPVLTIAGMIQTVPGLALLALMVPLLRQIGFLPAVIALILYSMLPVLRNTVTGIEQVDADTTEAGLGLGMTPRQLLFKVQLPLAMPVIVAGIRTAAVWVTGIATLSTPVGATSLGNYIFSGLQTQNYVAVTIGCVAAAALALVLDRLVRMFEIGLARRSAAVVRTAASLTLIVVVLGLAPVIRGTLQSDRSARVVIGTKTFTEQYILGEVIAEVLAEAGFQTQSRDSLGSTVAFDALASDRIDVYVDYTGTIWANYMRREDNPGREVIRSEVTQWLRREHGIEVIATLGFENAYALAMTRASADALDVASVTDLAPHAPELSMGGDYEFFGRPEWIELSGRYGLEFRELRTMDSTLMYAAVAAGEVDVITAFSTDGRIPAFDLVLLQEPVGALPPYDAILLAAPTVGSRVPGLHETLATLDNEIDGALMRTANRHVDLDGGSVSAAAELIIAQLAR